MHDCVNQCNRQLECMMVVIIVVRDMVWHFGVVVLVLIGLVIIFHLTNMHHMAHLNVSIPNAHHVHPSSPMLFETISAHWYVTFALIFEPSVRLQFTMLTAQSFLISGYTSYISFVSCMVTFPFYMVSYGTVYIHITL
jgi:hypothetical protein